MREIMSNGPVAAAFDAPASLFTYVSGVFTAPAYTPHARVCDSPSATDSRRSSLGGWEYTNHAVTIVGWGETDAAAATTATPAAAGDSGKLKYWIVRNTWGSSWGKGGYFLLIRGVNAGGIESQASFIDPDLTRGKGKQLFDSILAAHSNK